MPDNLRLDYTKIILELDVRRSRPRGAEEQLYVVGLGGDPRREDA
jgi:hypothetical protein